MAQTSNPGRADIAVDSGGAGASATLTAGTLTTSTTAAALAATLAVTEIMVQNDPDNTIDVFVGNATAQPLQLSPGDSLVLAVNDLAKVYVKSASGTPLVNYLARGG